MRKVKKPWGFEEHLAVNEKVTVKILHVSPRRRFSLQRHRHRNEFWKVLSPCRVWIGRRKVAAKVGDEFFIKKGVLHRIEGFSKVGRVLEISFGKFDDKDIVRVKDDYGRAGK